MKSGEAEILPDGPARARPFPLANSAKATYFPTERPCLSVPVEMQSFIRSPGLPLKQSPQKKGAMKESGQR